MSENDAPLLLDVSRLIWRRWTDTPPTGIDRICLAWLKHYCTGAQAVIIHRRGEAILPVKTSQALFKLLAQPRRRRGDRAKFRTALVRLAISHASHLRDRLDGDGRIWLNPGHTGLDSQRVSNWVKKRNVRLVPLVHDLIPITHPQFCRPGEDERHRQRMRTVLNLASGIITNSDHTLAVLREFSESEGKSLPPSVVAWPGTPPLATLSERPGIEPTFVVLGTIEGRKNHAFLLSLWRRLLQSRSRNQVPRLVIVGRRGWQSDHVFAQLASGEFGDRVTEAGALDDRDLADVLSQARALLFPSAAEGYGIPLVEALRAGVPVIATDLPVFREIGQGVPELLPLNDLDTWTAAILDYAEEASSRRRAQRSRLKSFRAPDWATHFSRIDQFLRLLEA